MGTNSPRMRFGGAKTRTGCVTCKARRVKCDETKPTCLRCRKVGRECGGYTLPAEARKLAGDNYVIYCHAPQSQLLLPTVSLPFSSTQLEQRGLEFYKLRTSLGLAGHFPIDIWSNEIIQVAQHEPAIWHALVAIGATHEQFESTTDARPANSEFAMRQYSKAIRLVVNLDIHESRRSTDVALITCILFFAFESLQGHYKSALTHINSGIQVLQEQEHLSEPSSIPYIPREVLRSIFVRLDTQSIEIGDATFRRTTKIFDAIDLLPLPPMFSDIKDALTTFDTYSNRLTHFLMRLDSLECPGCSADTAQKLIEEHTYLLQYLWKWGSAFDCGNFSDTFPSVLVLRINRTLFEVILQIDMCAGEMGWDVFTADFEKLTTLASKFQTLTLPAHYTDSDWSARTHPKDVSSDLHGVSRHLRSNPLLNQNVWHDTNHCLSDDSHSVSANVRSSKPTFTVAVGIIPALCITIFRCRHPVIRRRALNILSTCNRKEGVWDSVITAKVGERLIEIEESGADFSSPTPTSFLTGPSQIPECARISILETVFGVGKHGHIRYAKSNFGLSTPKVMIDEDIRW